MFFRVCCFAVLNQSYVFLQFFTQVTVLNEVDGICSFTLYLNAIRRLFVVSPNLLSASIRNVYD